MKYYTVKELAGQPGMPASESAVQKAAKREGWPFRKRPGRGGGCEYPLTCLPEATRIHLTATPVVTKTPSRLPAIVQEQPKSLAQKTEAQRQINDARLIIMRMIKALSGTIGVNKAIHRIIEEYNNGNLPQICMANARKGASRTLSYDGIMKWWMAWKRSGESAESLAPHDMKPRAEAPWVEMFEHLWGQPQKPTLTAVMEKLADVLPPHIPMPSYHQCRRHLEKMGAVDKAKGRLTGNELAQLKPYRRRLTDHMFPGDCFTADGHCFDAEVAHPYHGRPFRPEITMVIDVATRLAVGWSIDLAESGLAVLDALRFACENFATPVIFYTDNGCGYKNQMMTAPATGILSRLGITPEYARPRNPQGHGLSERGHKTILVKAAKQLCTYMGKDMDVDSKRLVYKATRKAVRTGDPSPLIEWDDFLDHINRAIAKYNNTPHSGLPAYRDQATRKRVHFTPWQYWQAGIQRATRELPEIEQPLPANDLPDLYHPAVERIAHRGYIQLGTLANGLAKMYFCRELEQRHGDRVQVAYSPADASRVWVRDLDSGRLIGIAELDGNASPYFAPSVIEQNRLRRGEQRLKRLENHAEEVRLEMHGPRQAIVPVEHSDEMKALRDQLKAADAAEVKTNVIAMPLPQPESPRQFIVPTDDRDKYKLWCALEGQRVGGLELTPEEQSFFDGYQRTAMWKAWKSVGK